METPASTARSLVFSFQEALDVFAAQGKRADEARKLADAAQARLKRLLEPNPVGEPPDTPGFLQSVRQNHTLEQQREEHRTDAALRVRWESIFCDIYLALMRLYATPSARRRVEQIAVVVRDIRLLQVEDVDVEPPDFPDFSQVSNTTSFVEEAGSHGSSGAEQDRKRQIFRQTLEVTGPHHDRMRDAYSARVDLTRSWLTLAREVATALELELVHGPQQPE